MDDPASDADCTGYRASSPATGPPSPHSVISSPADRLRGQRPRRHHRLSIRLPATFPPSTSTSRASIDPARIRVRCRDRHDAGDRLQRGRADEFHLRNDYDEDQRIVASYSSRDGRIWHRGHHEYTVTVGRQAPRTGPLGVEGVNCTYNLHGAIGVNAPTSMPLRIPDTWRRGLHQWLSPDVFGMHLAQYRGEFGRAGSRSGQRMPPTRRREPIQRHHGLHRVPAP